MLLDGAALVPRPQSNLILYHGVLAADARWRARVVAYGHSSPPLPAEPASCPNPTWAELMRRALSLDVLACPRCSGRMRFIAVVLEPTAVRPSLDHLQVPSEPVLLSPARSPPSDESPVWTA